MITSIVITAIVVLISFGVVVFDSRRKPVLRNNAKWLQHGIMFKVIGVVGVVITTHMLINKVPTQGDTALVFGLMFALLAVPTFLLGFFWKVGYDDTGIYCLSPWRRNRFVPWSDVKSIGFSNSMKQWIVETATQGNIRINELVPGVSQFVLELKQHCGF